MNYIDVLSESLNITWKHKALWVFGILVAVLGQGAYQFQVNYRESINSSNIASIPEDHIIFDILREPVKYIVIGLLISIAVWLVSQLIAWFGSGAMIGMVTKIDENRAVSVRDGWESGKEHGIKLFLTYLVINIPVFVLGAIGAVIFYSFFLNFFALMGPEMLSGNYQPSAELNAEFAAFAPDMLLALFCGMPLVCGAGLLRIVIQLINEFAARAVVLEGLEIRPAIERGWFIFRKNVGYIILTVIIIGVIGVVLSLVLGIPAIALWMPVIGPLLNGVWTSSSIFSGILLVLYGLVVYAGLSGFATAYMSVLWTRFFQYWTIDYTPTLDFEKMNEPAE